jgi:hypothetical protein
MADITTLGPPPVITDVDNQLVIAWPEGKEETFIMRTSLLEAMVLDINGGKRLAAALNEVRAIIGRLA